MSLNTCVCYNVQDWVNKLLRCTFDRTLFSSSNISFHPRVAGEFFSSNSTWATLCSLILLGWNKHCITARAATTFTRAPKTAEGLILANIVKLRRKNWGEDRRAAANEITHPNEACPLCRGFHDLNNIKKHWFDLGLRNGCLLSF